MRLVLAHTCGRMNVASAAAADMETQCEQSFAAGVRLVKEGVGNLDCHVQIAGHS